MFKRILDILVAVLVLVILSPLLLVIAGLIKIQMGSPIFFQQVRPGLAGCSFKMFKFRTMLNASTHPHLDDNARITKFGRFLRKTSLDELPEFWNVLKGDMSLVGPRPLLVEYLSRYTPAQARRHNVRPGITGWAQVNGRNALNWEEKFKLDTWYVDHQSFGLDIKILCLTIKRVLKKEGINAANDEIMPVFLGVTSQDKEEAQ